MIVHSPLAVVLAGGINSRFWPLREKSLLSLCDATLLERHLDELIAADVTEVVIVGTPDNAERLHEITSYISGCKVQVVVQSEALGMGDALLTAARSVPVVSERPLLVTQVHDLFSDHLTARVLAAFRHDPAMSYLGAYRSASYFPGGYFKLDGERLGGLIEKPEEGHEPSDLVSVVVRLHRDPERLIELIQQEYMLGGADDHYERAIAKQMREHEHRPVVHSGVWSALKYPWHVLDAVDLVLGQIQRSQISPEAEIHSSAAISGPVVIAPGARLMAGSAITGPAYVGRDVIVGNNALVRQSIVEHGSVIGFGSEIARSYIGPQCSFHTNYVGDSVIGEGSSFGAGTVTANLRLDHEAVPSMVKGERLVTGRQKLGLVCGRHATIGVQVATMPGIKIGEHAVVGPGVVVYRDVPDHTQVMLRQELRTFARRAN
ncbi:MAG: NTP transferase domain-containing protein [Chloroflexi bacterium]|nr:NTP transferase domain-containing protein [Chloroflexota bacterium]